jgi:hypothetical protein
MKMTKRQKRCELCGSPDASKYPPEFGHAILGDECAREAVRQTWEAYPEDFVELPGGGWGLRSNQPEH